MKGKRLLCFWRAIVWLVIGHTSITSLAQTETDLREQTIQAAIDIVSPSVVQLELVLDELNTAFASRATGPRSAVVLSADGWLVTASANLAMNPRAIGVRLPSQEIIPAELIGHDTSRHLALLKIPAEGLPVPRIADKASIRVGQTVIAVGKSFQPDRPFVSEGIVSAIDRFWKRAIQTDAKVSPRNYGGALCNLRGEVLGILLPLGDQSEEDVLSGTEWYDSGIGFAIPLEDVVKNLERWQTAGELRKGFLGANFSGPANLYGEPRVTSCWPGSPAALSGLKTGDFILQIDGQPVVTVADLKFAIDGKYAGDKLHVEWESKNGAVRNAIVELVATLPEYRLAAVGIVPDRDQTTPLRIGRVVSGSAAEKNGLIPGDRLVAFDDQPLNSWEELRSLLRERLPGDSLALDVRRLGGGMFRANLELEVASAEPLGRVDTAQSLPIEIKEILITEFPNRCWRIDSSANDVKTPVLIWLADPGKKSRDEIAKQWSGLVSYGACVIVVESSRDDRWLTDEAFVVIRALQIIARDREIDPERVAIGGRQSGAELAALVVTRHRNRFRGLVLEDHVRPSTIEKMSSVPEAPLYVLLSERFPNATAHFLDPSDPVWRNWKVPRATVDLRNVNDQEWSSQLLNWLESLDRL